MDRLTDHAGIASDRTRLVRFAVNVLQRPREDIGDRAGHPHVVTVARLDAADTYKGIDTLLEAWPAVIAIWSDAVLSVAGDGDDRARLHAMASGLGVGHAVRFLGHVDDKTLHRLYRSANVFALPGRTSRDAMGKCEGFGLVFLEAAAHGLPCVAGRAGGAVEAIAHGVSGLLVDPESPADVASAINRLLSDPILADQLGAAGRDRVCREFSVAQFSAGVARVIDELAARGVARNATREVTPAAQAG